VCESGEKQEWTSTLPRRAHEPRREDEESYTHAMADQNKGSELLRFHFTAPVVRAPVLELLEQPGLVVQPEPQLRRQLVVVSVE